MPVSGSLTFLKQTFRAFRTTGAVAPSSPFLARAMVRDLPPKGKAPAVCRVLEVGAGTGAFTKAIVRRLDGHGRLDLWEINPHFCAHLRRLMQSHAHFKRMGARIELREGDIRALPAEPVYDCILSGLPLNNFTPAEVRGFMLHFKHLLKPGGTLTYFEYLAIRRLQTPFVGHENRKRLNGVAQVVRDLVLRHQVREEFVALNVPPAVVRSLRFSPSALVRH